MTMTATDFSRTQRPREDWLSLAAPEPALEPELEIVDTHVHLWQHASGYGYFLPDLARDTHESGHNVTSAVYVECNSMYRAAGPAHLRPAGESEFAAGQAAMSDSGLYGGPRIRAVTGFADLTLGAELDELLEAHGTAAQGRLRAVRMRAKWDPDPVVKGAVSADAPGLYLQSAFQDGLRRLAARGLAFEASIYHPQIPDVAAAARAVPEAEIVLIHTGSPVGHSSYRGREAEVLADWTRGMRDLASCPNVTVKLGGLLMTLAAYDFGRAERPIGSAALAGLWRPYIERSIEIFGPKRCMVSSNFPVERAGITYGTNWNMFKRLTAAASAGEKQQIYSGTAKRVYRLEDG